MNRRAVALGILGSAVVLVYLVARGPAWYSLAVVLAALLPAGLVLYGGAARGRSNALRAAQVATERAFRRSEEANQDLQDRVAELITLNELAAAAGSTLDRDELLDRRGRVATSLPWPASSSRRHRSVARRLLAQTARIGHRIAAAANNCAGGRAGYQPNTI